MTETQVRVPRCTGCGKWHPFITPCPYVKSLETRMEGKAFITRTEYFPTRLELLSEEQVITTIEELSEPEVGSS